MSVIEVKVPDIGDFKNIPVIEIMVGPGDTIKQDDPLISLESDKAAMEVPSPAAGTVREVKVQIGDKVSEGSLILVMDAEGAVAEPHAAPQAGSTGNAELAFPPPPVIPPAAVNTPAPAPAPLNTLPDFGGVNASPSVRRLARELEVDLSKIIGSGDKGRITKDDVKAFLTKGAPAQTGAVSGGMGIPEVPAVDFSKFGEIEVKPLARIKKISGPHLHRSWLNVPHVTHNDEADITEIEAFRKELDNEGKAAKTPYRVSLLPFLIKASIKVLKQYPAFNSSLTPEKDALVYKKYYNIGIAVDTPDGLVVPVIKEADRKGIIELSKELGDLSTKARDGKLSAAEMTGASFTISSLGGIGGTAFTPIVNAPEVAILGVVRSKMAPVWDGSDFKPRLMLPLCLSYDHRVVDGAAAARFMRALASSLEDIRRMML
jgi:pyruvate dehydrogenase E2 component (dihydrolipoamide acetyltransferase)